MWSLARCRTKENGIIIWQEYGDRIQTKLNYLFIWTISRNTTVSCSRRACSRAPRYSYWVSIRRYISCRWSRPVIQGASRIWQGSPYFEGFSFWYITVKPTKRLLICSKFRLEIGQSNMFSNHQNWGHNHDFGGDMGV